MTAAPSDVATVGRTRRARRSASRSTVSPPRTARSPCGSATRCGRCAWRRTGWWDTWRSVCGAESDQVRSVECGMRNVRVSVERHLAPRPRPINSALRIPHSGGVAVRVDDFRALVDHLLKDVPPAYLDGVMAVEVSPKSLPHPVRGDVVVEGAAGRPRLGVVEIGWHGRRYRVRIARSPRRAALFVSLQGLAEAPPGEAVLVLRPRASLLDLFRNSPPPVPQTVAAEPLDG